MSSSDEAHSGPSVPFANNDAGYPQSDPVPKSRDKMYDGVLNLLQAHEEKMARMTNPDIPDIHVGLRIPFTVGDVAFLIEDIYRGKSAISGLPTRLTLIRWCKPDNDMVDIIGAPPSQGQKASKLSFSDLVCVTKDEAARHEQIFRGEKTYEDLYCHRVLARVARRQKEAAAYEDLRR